MTLRTVEDVARAAFDATNAGLALALRKAYPGGCQFSDALAWAKALPWKGTDWKEQEFLLLYLCGTVGPGPEKTIDGQVVWCDRVYGAWSGCDGLPSFESLDAARQFAIGAGFNLVK